MHSPFKEQLRAVAFWGAVAWAITLFLRTAEAPETDLIQRILLLGIFVIVPLGFSLIPSQFHSAPVASYLARFSPIAAVAGFVSILLEPGWLAAILIVPWLLISGCAALGGLKSLFRTELRGPAELSISAALIYLPVGAVWLFAYRLGMQPLGFGDTIVLLTAVHFHFAGFAAPLLAGLSGRLVAQRSNTTTLLTVAVIGVIAGTPLVAAGITASPLVAMVGAAVISVGLLALSVLTVRYVVPSTDSIVVRVLLLVSSLAVLPAMALACVYAYSIVFTKLIIDIPQMAMTHGMANAFGFALCGLTAWAILDD